MNTQNPVATYALRLGDNGLVLAQRLGAWCGHAPELEIDLALANIGLDLLGQARNFLSYAAELNGSGDEDVCLTKSLRLTIRLTDFSSTSAIRGREQSTKSAD